MRSDNPQSWQQVSEDFVTAVRLHSAICAMGFPTLVTPTLCSEILREWIGKLTQDDYEKLRLWGIPTKLLKAADVEVSRHLLCAAARFWKSAHHVFRFGRTELRPTLEEVLRICGFSKILGPPIFMRRDGYIAVLKQLTGLSTKLAR